MTFGSPISVSGLDQVLTTTLHASLAVLVGLVFLMTTKPPLGPSVVVILAAVVIGAASSFQFRKG